MVMGVVRTPVKPVSSKSESSWSGALLVLQEGIFYFVLRGGGVCRWRK